MDESTGPTPTSVFWSARSSNVPQRHRGVAGVRAKTGAIRRALAGRVLIDLQRSGLSTACLDGFEWRHRARFAEYTVSLGISSSLQPLGALAWRRISGSDEPSERMTMLLARRASAELAAFVVSRRATPSRSFRSHRRPWQVSRKNSPPSEACRTAYVTGETVAGRSRDDRGGSLGAHCEPGRRTAPGGPVLREFMAFYTVGYVLNRTPEVLYDPDSFVRTYHALFPSVPAKREAGIRARALRGRLVPALGATFV